MCKEWRAIIQEICKLNGITSYNDSLNHCIEYHQDISVTKFLKEINRDNQMTSFITCKYNNRRILQYLKNINKLSYTHGFKGACKGGYLDIAKDMVSLGAENYN